MEDYITLLNCELKTKTRKLWVAVCNEMKQNFVYAASYSFFAFEWKFHAQTLLCSPFKEDQCRNIFLF